MDVGLVIPFLAMHEKLHNVEFLRFSLAVSIVYYHLLHASLPRLAPTVGVYADLAEKSAWGGLAVEGFLVMAGFFLCRSILSKHKASKTFAEIATDRFVRLWPVFAFYTLVHGLFFRLDLESALNYLLLLHATGLSMSHIGIIWYIAPFFWGSLFVAAVLKAFRPQIAGLLLGTLAFLGYAVNIQHTNGGLGREVVFSFLSLALVRAIAGLSLGCLLSFGVDSIPPAPPGPTRRSRLGTVAATLLEIATGGLLFKLLLVGRGNLRNSMTVVFLFVFFAFLLVLRRGLLSRVLDWRGFDFLGRYSYSIYVMQQTAFYMLMRSLWKKTELLQERPLAVLVVSAVFTIAVGVATYHLVERPCALVWRRARAKRP